MSVPGVQRPHLTGRSLTRPPVINMYSEAPPTLTTTISRLKGHCMISKGKTLTHNDSHRQYSLALGDFS